MDPNLDLNLRRDRVQITRITWKYLVPGACIILAFEFADALNTWKHEIEKDKIESSTYSGSNERQASDKCFSDSILYQKFDTLNYLK